MNVNVPFHINGAVGRMGEEEGREENVPDIVSVPYVRIFEAARRAGGSII